MTINSIIFIKVQYLLLSKTPCCIYNRNRRVYMKMRTVGDQIIIRIIEKNETTINGIILPETVNMTTNQQGEITHVGGKSINGDIFHMETKVGDIALFPKGAGKEVVIKGSKYIVIKEKDVYGILSTG